MKKLTLILSIVLVAAMFMTACSGNAQTPSSGSSAADSASPSGDAVPSDDAAPAGDGEKYVMRAASAASAEVNMYWQAMITELEKAFPNGEVTLEPYWNGEMASINREQLEMVRSNILQWQTVPAFEFFTQSPQLSNFLFFDLPFVFDSYQQFYDFVDSDFAWEQMYKPADQQLGIKIAGVHSQGIIELGTTKKPITNTEDTKNLKIRTSLSEIYVEMVKSWGAAPTSLEWSECYTGLQQGAIDGLTTGASLMTVSRLYEPLEYITDIHAIMFNHVAFYNADFWNSLPDDYRAKLEELQPAVDAEGRKGHEALENEAWETLRETCEVHELTAEERKTFTDPAKAVWESKADLIGREFLTEALAMVGKEL